MAGQNPPAHTPPRAQLEHLVNPEEEDNHEKDKDR